jgi:hypothetical protein
VPFFREAVKNRTSDKINSKLMKLMRNRLRFCGLWASPRISTDMSASVYECGWIHLAVKRQYSIGAAPQEELGVVR